MRPDLLTGVVVLLAGSGPPSGVSCVSCAGGARLQHRRRPGRWVPVAREPPCLAASQQPRSRSAWCEREGQLDLHITHEQIRRGQGLCLDGQCYDARSLRPWLRQNGRLPHNRAAFSAASLDLLLGVAVLRRSLRGQHALNAVAYGVGGRVATGSVGGQLQIWNVQAQREEPLTLVGHLSAISAVQFSPDGSLVVTASLDETARVWDTRTGKELQRLLGHADALTCAAFCPTGVQVLTGSDDGTLRLWDVRAGRKARRYGISAPVTAVAFRPPGGREAVVGCSDGSVRLLDLESGEERLHFVAHSGLIHSVSFSPTGHRFVTASEDSTAKIFDAATGFEERCLRGHRRAVFAAEFGPGSAGILTGSLDSTARLWDAESGVQLWGVEDSRRNNPVTSVAFNPAGGTAVLAIGETARIIDASA